ncbi:MAG TPA: RNA methyltransferase [Jatrophihabitans sp.]|jgi:tRNA G18 (ribose-2'-O)-methylase SpoU|nr:RNA methyltransferase [Jatrophihabitans sp.]
MYVVEIGDPADPRLDDFRGLTDADVRPDRRGIVIAEGVNVVERLASSPLRVRAVLGVPARIDVLGPALAHLDVPGYAVDKWVLSDVVGFRVTRGVLAAADRPGPIDPADLLARSRRVAVLEALNDFENLGALFRNAAAFGVDAVLLDPRCADPFYRRSVRVSMGHALRVPFALLPDPWPDSLGMVRGSGFALLAMTPDRSAIALRDVVPPQRWAVLLGAEGPGLSAAALAAADVRVRIPMAPGVDSLNVATAAAVAFAHLT